MGGGNELGSLRKPNRGGVIMLKTDTVTINGVDYIRTWSDADMMIERNGEMYEEAIDPIDSGRTYTETNQPIVHDMDMLEGFPVDVEEG